jgi:hypothetical protein
MLHWSGPVITLLGVVLGAYATLLMCREYHAFGTWDIIRHLFWIAGKLATGRTEDARNALKDASEFARINAANQYRTLAGVYVLVFSFLVQTVGAILILVDLFYTK